MEAGNFIILPLKTLFTWTAIQFLEDSKLLGCLFLKPSLKSPAFIENEYLVVVLLLQIVVSTILTRQTTIVLAKFIASCIPYGKDNPIMQ